MQSIAEDISKNLDLLKTMAKSLGIDLAAALTQEKEKTQKRGKDPEEEIKEITQNILKGVKAKTGKIQTKKSAGGKILYYHVQIGQSPYVLKSYFLDGIGHVSLILWDETQKTLLDVIASGETKDFHKLIAVGKSRLSKWG